MSTPILRPYQQALADGIRAQFRRHRSVLAVAPTGSGKTVLFSYITHGAVAKGNSVMILAHRIELIDQISGTLKDFGVRHGFIAAGYPRARLPVQVASTATLARRLDGVPAPSLIIIDEAHHATAKNTIGKILAHFHKSRVLGVTATPCRLSGEGLEECFSAMVLGPSIQELVDMGALSPARVFAPPSVNLDSISVRGGDYAQDQLAREMDKPKITGDAVDHYKKHCPDAPAVAFCVSVDHARHVAAQFTQSGIPSSHIDGGMDRELRRIVIQEFKDGKVKVLTSCDLISEGFDCPGIVAGILLRPTASLGLYMQQVGRCLRPYAGKREAIILDHAGNTGRHGLPTEAREWSLAGREQSQRRAKAEPSISVRICPSCFAAERPGRTHCGQCNAPYPVNPRAVQEVSGELEEVTEARSARKEQGQARDLAALTELGKMRGYRNPRAWAEHVIRGRKAKGRAA